MYVFYEGFTAVFTNLGKSGTKGPDSVGSHYTGQDHDGQVTVSSGIQLWTVPHTGEYRIETIGASGGYSEDSVINGGRGARMIGNFMLTKGENISILVGQRGEKVYYKKKNWLRRRRYICSKRREQAFNHSRRWRRSCKYDRTIFRM